ncbi:unnamed protein product [Didymodactylos carnosus]|uniref:Uncharacterized protein n=1 Tax=Didymodactylos carnosus TaxID=1234261 RepID=A0A8S2XGD3_9BILA|nr:unnamed protein product [Didymodactylos carnosus]
MALIAEKENSDLIRFVNEKFEPEEQMLREKGLNIDHNGQQYSVHVIMVAWLNRDAWFARDAWLNRG